MGVLADNLKKTRRARMVADNQRLAELAYEAEGGYPIKPMSLDPWDKKHAVREMTDIVEQMKKRRKQQEAEEEKQRTRNRQRDLRPKLLDSAEKVDFKVPFGRSRS